MQTATRVDTKNNLIKPEIQNISPLKNIDNIVGSNYSEVSKQFLMEKTL
jgi:hypothetical protein